MPIPPSGASTSPAPGARRHRGALMRTNRSNFGVAVLGGKVYTAGGYGNYGLSAFPVGFTGATTGTATWSGGRCTQPDLDVYDPLEDTWSLLPPMGGPRGGLALVALPSSQPPVLVAAGGFRCVNGPSHTV